MATGDKAATANANGALERSETSQKSTPSASGTSDSSRLSVISMFGAGKAPRGNGARPREYMRGGMNVPEKEAVVMCSCF